MGDSRYFASDSARPIRRSRSDGPLTDVATIADLAAILVASRITGPLRSGECRWAPYIHGCAQESAQSGRDAFSTAQPFRVAAVLRHWQLGRRRESPSLLPSGIAVIQVWKHFLEAKRLSLFWEDWGSKPARRRYPSYFRMVAAFESVERLENRLLLSATKLAFTTVPTTGTAGQALGTLKVSVENASGVVQTGDTSTVTIAVASGPGGLTSGSTTSVAAVSGVATFTNLVLDTTGTYTLKATDGSLTSTTSGNITVSAAAASQLVLQQSPTSGTAGTALSSTKVDVEDAFGNIVTSNTSTVTIAVASGPGGLTAGSTTSVAAVSGVATFSNLVLDTAGTYTLKATDGALDQRDVRQYHRQSGRR